jgi:AcrR family transcriptional regulator
MARPLDPDIDQAIEAATLTLLTERGFARMSMEAVAAAAGVGKPAIYRRFPDKAALVAKVIAGQLPALDPPDMGDTRAELWQAVEQGLPADGAGYVGLIGGLIAEQERHPELIEAFRRSVLHPRRATVRALIERGQARGDLRGDVDPVAALDLLAGPFLARVFAGADTGPRWRKQAFAIWWDILEERQDP